MAESKEPQKMYQYCLRCGRKLVSVVNRERGMGKVCWQKTQTERKNERRKLF